MNESHVRRTSRPCRDCCVDVGDDYNYIVKNNVWPKEKGKRLKGILCLNCLETRLGRKLIKDDFNWTIALNYFVGSEALESRKNWTNRTPGITMLERRGATVATK